MSSSTTLAQDACLICQYPSWIEAPGEEDQEPELMCSNFEELQLSSINGCLGCSLLVQAWKYGAPATEQRTRESITFNRCSGNLYVHLFKHPRGVVNIDVFTIAEEPLFKHVRPAALIPSSTILAENLGTIQKWLQTCEERHSICRKSSIQVPPRLLDLESDESSDIIRLVDQKEIQQSWTLDIPPGEFRYACLSHCWGKTRHRHLTRESNLKDNLRGIPIADLPRTFRDAIAVSRALSIRYLWIDSLCIVQDDHADWKMHVSRMAQLYRKAFITLAAGASEDDDGGFFQQAMPPFVSVSSFMLHDGEKDYGIYLRKCLPHPDEGWPAGQEMPLMNRGWVFQERLLSRRFLCFAANEVLWECLEDVACSCSTTTNGFNHHIKSSKPAFPNCPPSKFDFAKLRDLPKEELWSLWRQLVSQYTRRELTFPDDKLPALAGLVQRFQPFNGSDYVHGIWIDCIKQDILWRNLAYSDNELRPRKAPSWSWVSAADGGIEMENTLHSSRISVVCLISQKYDDNEIDKISWGLLSVRGPLMHISLREKEIFNGMEAFRGYRSCSVNECTASKNHRGTIPESIKAAARINLDSQNTQTSSHIPRPPETIGAEAQLKSGEFWADYKFWSDEEKLWQVLDDVFFLELGIEREEFFGGDKADCHVAGLILRPCDRELDGITIYERIGWLRCSTGKPSADWEPAGVMSEIMIE